MKVGECDGGKADGIDGGSGNNSTRGESGRGGTRETVSESKRTIGEKESSWVDARAVFNLVSGYLSKKKATDTQNVKIELCENGNNTPDPA